MTWPSANVRMPLVTWPTPTPSGAAHASGYVVGSAAANAPAAFTTGSAAANAPAAFVAGSAAADAAGAYDDGFAAGVDSVPSGGGGYLFS